MWRSNTKPKLYEATAAYLVWTVDIYCAPSTNRNKPHLHEQLMDQSAKCMMQLPLVGVQSTLPEQRL